MKTEKQIKELLKLRYKEYKAYEGIPDSRIKIRQQETLLRCIEDIRWILGLDIMEYKIGDIETPKPKKVKKKKTWEEDMADLGELF